MNPNIQKAFNMFNAHVEKNRDYIRTARLGWEVVELYHPGYDAKIQNVVPIVLIDYKY